MAIDTQIHPSRLRADLRRGPDGGDVDAEDFDPVLYTAGDRPSDSTIPPLVDPTADHSGSDVAQRRADVEEKHRRIIEFLDRFGHDAVLLTRADSLAWFTAGGDLGRDLGSDLGSVALFVNRNLRAVLSDNVQGARVFEEELAGLGFQLKERPWYADRSRVVAELTHSRKVVADAHLDHVSFAARPLRSLRRPLTGRERELMRSLGRTLTLAVEATCRNFRPGETEADVAGHLAHRLFREGVVPVDLRVAGDDRLDRYRQATFKAAPILRRATISAVGRRHGLCASLSRAVAFGPIDRSFRDAHSLASMVDATCIYFSRPGEAISEVFRRARRIYEKFDHADEWMLDYQGSLIGYARNEGSLRPDSAEALEDGSAISWNPSVGAARSEDTVVIDSRGFEVVTEAQDWPKVDVFVKGFPIPRPGILER